MESVAIRIAMIRTADVIRATSIRRATASTQTVTGSMACFAPMRDRMRRCPLDAGYYLDAGPQDAEPADGGGPQDAAPSDAEPTDAAMPMDAEPSSDAAAPMDAAPMDAAPMPDAG